MVKFVGATLMGVWTRVPLAVLVGTRVGFGAANLMMLLASWTRMKILLVVTQITAILLRPPQGQREYALPGLLAACSPEGWPGVWKTVLVLLVIGIVLFILERRTSQTVAFRAQSESLIALLALVGGAL